MKKIGIILTIAIALTLVVGCASSGGGSSSSAASSGGGTAEVKPYTVDLGPTTYDIFTQSTKRLGTPGKGVKNTTALGRRYDGVLFYLSGITADLSQYRRITINAKYFDKDGKEIPQGDSNAMVVLVYDPKGDLEGPEMGPGKNTPLKEFNVGGFSGAVSTDRGSRLTLSQAPGAILLQCVNDNVKFIELTQITFHNNTASGQ